MKKVIVEFGNVDIYGTKSEKECIELVHKILMGGLPFPLMDPIRPYVGTMVKIRCGNTEEVCLVWNVKNTEL